MSEFAKSMMEALIGIAISFVSVVFGVVVVFFAFEIFA